LPVQEFLDCPFRHFVLRFPESAALNVELHLSNPSLIIQPPSLIYLRKKLVKGTYVDTHYLSANSSVLGVIPRRVPGDAKLHDIDQYTVLPLASEHISSPPSSSPFPSFPSVACGGTWGRVLAFVWQGDFNEWFRRKALLFFDLAWNDGRRKVNDWCVTELQQAASEEAANCRLMGRAANRGSDAT
jgi:hypothetical protein